MQASNESPSTLRIGKVSQFDPNTLRARVDFPDMGIISHWLPLLVLNTLKTKDEYFLDEGEHVVCIMQGTGAEAGFILGAIFDDKNSPTVCDKDKRSVTFDDNTSIIYDRKEHKLSIDCAGDIDIHAKGNINIIADGNINEQAARIDLN